ncbi:hypothetical protein FRC02_000549 [Tulasnella sp. 418]|nr:hypothetical protein FRC02_000549 [Tulasnella sp. 418]
MSQCAAPPEPLGTPDIQSSLPNGETIASVFPPSYTLQPTPPTMSLVAARKAALLQKFGVREIVQTPESTSTPSPTFEWSWKNRIKELEAPKMNSYVRERRDTLDSFPPAKTLTSTPTGSTLASTVVDTGVDEVPPLRSSQSSISVGNRVKMAIANYNQRSETSTVIKVTDENGVSGQRSWSRLSGATKVHDDWNSPSRKSGLSEMSPVMDIHSLSVDDIFDTHPPDMISPRTMLAHVLEPPKPKPKTSPFPALFHLEKPVKGISTSISTNLQKVDKPSTETCSITKVPDPVPEPKTLPSDLPVEQPVPEKVAAPIAEEPQPALLLKSNTPKWIRGAGRLTDRNRALSVSASNRPSLHARNSSRGSTASISIQRARRTSTISRSVSYSHSSPLTLRAQNAIPLRKVALPDAPKPFRVSANI